MGKKRPFARTERLGSQIREVIATALMLETREELLRQVVITEVDVTSDVSLARVYWHGFPGVADVDREAVSAAFLRATRFLRSKVGEVVRARLTPELRFIHDDAIDNGRRIEAVLRTIVVPPAEAVVAAAATPEAEADDDRDGRPQPGAVGSGAEDDA